MQWVRILVAACRAFARKGQAAETQVAGVSRGLAYRYFAGKEQI